jgi:hypothetical protein
VNGVTDHFLQDTVTCHFRAPQVSFQESTRGAIAGFTAFIVVIFDNAYELTEPLAPIDLRFYPALALAALAVLAPAPAQAVERRRELLGLVEPQPEVGQARLLKRPDGGTTLRADGPQRYAVDLEREFASQARARWSGDERSRVMSEAEALGLLTRSGPDCLVNGRAKVCFWATR